MAAVSSPTLLQQSYRYLWNNYAAGLSLTYVRGFHLGVSAQEGKYHYLEKKRKIRLKREEELKARYERLDEEDRPTGCILCPKRIDIDIDYKNVRLLSQYVSPHTGRIYGRQVTGLCEKRQRQITNAIKRSRAMGLLPITMKYLEFHDDPKLF